MHEIFRIGKYKEKIKIDKIRGYQKGGPSVGPFKTQTFQPFKLDT